MIGEETPISEATRRLRGRAASFAAERGLSTCPERSAAVTELDGCVPMGYKISRVWTGHRQEVSVRGGVILEMLRLRCGRLYSLPFATKELLWKRRESIVHRFSQIYADFLNPFPSESALICENLERQAKPGEPCDMKGDHHVN